jgi:uncharacterized membrane protein
MSSSNVTTLTQKLESLPEDIREKFAQYLNDHFEELTDESLWDEQFNNTEKFSEIANKVRQEISLGKAEPFNIEKL